MKRFADNIRNYDGSNPFRDNQSRNYSDNKVINEFYPTSKFWTLFNDQHEVLIGTRGSGKTFLLRMMRFSMLKNISHKRAEKLVKEKRHIALYVPMYLEDVGLFSTQNVDESLRTLYFQFWFNSLLAVSFLNELLSILEENQNKSERVFIDSKLAKIISSVWFNSQSHRNISSLETAVRNLFYYYCRANGKGLDGAPPIFINQICSSLQSVRKKIVKELNLDEDPTWIICIDDAEFLDLPFQRCINSVFRHASERLVLKVATLPFYHKTCETAKDNVFVAHGNDFNYKITDMQFNSDDFIYLTNNLCKKRIIEHFSPEAQIEQLEDFLGIIGKDNLIDYYREEFGEKDADRNIIETKIKSELTKTRQLNVDKYDIDSKSRKPVYDKYAPIFFTREMYRLSRIGNTIPGWYAGSSMVRKLSQGNPRIFLRIMFEMFEKARTSVLTPKAQHDILLKFVNEFCDETQSLEKHGPDAKRYIEKIAQLLQDRVHNGPLIFCGNTFMLKISEKELDEHKSWLKLAVAYLRLFVNDSSLLYGTLSVQ